MYFFRREGLWKHHRFCKKILNFLDLGVWEKIKGVTLTEVEGPKIRAQTFGNPNCVWTILAPDGGPSTVLGVT